MRATALKATAVEDPITARNIRAIVAKQRGCTIPYLELRGMEEFKPHSSARLIRLLVEMKRKGEILFDTNMVVSLPG